MQDSQTWLINILASAEIKHPEESSSQILILLDVDGCFGLDPPLPVQS